jgi:hypothetical protein
MTLDFAQTFQEISSTGNEVFKVNGVYTENAPAA